MKRLFLKTKFEGCSKPVAFSYFNLGYPEIARKARKSYDQFQNGEALQNKGVVLERLCFEEAMQVYDFILANKPDSETTKFNKSMCLMLMGEYKKGFLLYESRYNRETNLLQNYRGDEPVWDGLESIEGKRLLIHPEQGVGDTLMVSRFINLIENLGGELILLYPRTRVG